MTSILIVEDEPVVAAALKLQLLDCGYEVAGVVGKGEAVAKQVQSSTPDLVLMDIVLAGSMDGVAAAENIRALNDIPVIFLTAYADDAFFRRAKVTEPYAYLLKPSTSREIQLAIEIALYRHKTERSARAILEKAVTERTAELNLAQRRLSKIMETISDAFISLDLNGHFLYVNAKAGMLFGRKPADLLGKHIWAEFPDKVDQPLYHAYQQAMAERTPIVQEMYDHSRECHFEIRLFPSEDCLSIFFHDITERKKKDEQLVRLIKLYSALSHCNQTIVHCTNENELFQHVCRDAVLLGGLKMAWVGLVDQASQMVKPVAWYGSGTEYLDGIQISADSNLAAGQGPTGVATRQNQPYWCQDYLHEPSLAPWHERGKSSGWAASAALPLLRNDVVVGTLNLYSGVVDAFDEAARNLLLGMATDISYALTRFSLRAERDQAEMLFRSAVEAAPNAMLMVDAQGVIVLVNAQVSAVFGYSEQELMGQSINILLPKDYHQAHAEHVMRFVRLQTEGRKMGQGRDLVGQHKDGRKIPIEVGLNPLQTSAGNFVIASVLDITERKQAMEQLLIAAATFETQEAIVITDTNANIIRVNQAFQKITGYSQEEVIGQNPRIMNSGRQNQDFYKAMWQQLLSVGTWSGEVWDKRKNGEIYPKWLTITAIKNDSGITFQYVAIFSDLTNRKQSEEEIRSLAFSDPLTRLPNRRLLRDRLNSALSTSSRNHYYGAVLMLDLDKFKVINDALGHDYGDLMLIEAASRIQSCVREVDTVARLGGDEFVVLIEEVDEHAAAASQKVALVAEKIRAALSEPYQLRDRLQHSTTSIGVSLYLGNEKSIDILLKCADIAMYQAKDAGRNAVRFFDPAMQQAVETHAALEADLRHAVPDRQLHLYYQIQMGSDLRPIGAEALIRWIHPTRGMVPPMQFIPIAEESSLILDIGGWVLDTACRQLSTWIKQEQTRNLIIAVNVSAQQFKQPDFVETVATVLRTHAIEASHLKLELTESVVLSDVEDVVAKMHALKALGVRLSMDDFGTGYSSLAYLKQLPLDQLKIDQSFVRDMISDPNDAVMVRTIIDMAHNFRLNVIAEGVETEAQMTFLKQLGCMTYQGYHFGKPVPIEQFEALLKKI